MSSKRSIARFSERFRPPLGVHLVGVGGAGLSGLARMLLARGFRVSGSDLRESRVTRALQSEGVEVSFQQQLGELPDGTGAVIASAAVPLTHPELRRAVELELPVLRYAQALGMLMAEREGIGIAGTHGKTTTTAMVANMLDCAGVDPSWLVGGQPSNELPSARAGLGPHFVAEACEYRRSFHNLQPRYAIITNLEAEHLDYYRSLDEIRDSFTQFLRPIADEGLALVNGDDREARRVAREACCRYQTFGFRSHNDWQATGFTVVDGHPTFEVHYQGSYTGVTIELRVPGRHNVYNALAAAALGFHLEVPKPIIAASFQRFHGVDRRFQILSNGRFGPTVVDDYAHHPTEIEAVIEAARSRYPGRRLVAVVEPHQHSRMIQLFSEFVRVLQDADEVVVTDIYACRDSAEDQARIHAVDLAGGVARAGTTCRYLVNEQESVPQLSASLQPQDVVVFMGAGRSTELAHRLAEALELQKRPPTSLAA